MTETREDPSGRPGYKSWVKGLRVGVDAEDYRSRNAIPLEGGVMKRASELAAQALARGRTPKNTIKLEDVLGAEGSTEDGQTVRGNLRRERYQR